MQILQKNRPRHIAGILQKALRLFDVEQNIPASGATVNDFYEKIERARDDLAVLKVIHVPLQPPVDKVPEFLHLMLPHIFRDVHLLRKKQAADLEQRPAGELFLTFLLSYSRNSRYKL